MVTVVESGVERTFLQAVNRAINKIGENSVASLSNPTKRIMQAKEAVQDARDEVYYHTMWEFRRKYHRIELVESTMWYDLPGNYQKMSTGISLNRSQEPNLEKYTYEKLLERWPDLRSFPPGAGVADISTVQQLAEQNLTFGESKVYCTVDGYVGLMPIPDANFVDLEGILYMSYWAHATILESDNDGIGLPMNLWGAADLIASSNLRKTLEYSDWETDYMRGTKLLSREASGGKLGPEDLDNDQSHSINYNE